MTGQPRERYTPPPVAVVTTRRRKQRRPDPAFDHDEHGEQEHRGDQQSHGDVRVPPVRLGL